MDNIPEGYKQTEVGVIPQGWEVKKLEAIADIDPENLNNSTNPEYSFQYISLEDVDYGTLRNTTELLFKNAPSRARRKIRKDDILLSTVRPNLKSHLLIKKEISNWICSTGFSVVRCKDNIAHSGFVFNHFFSSVIDRQIETLITGSNYPAINSKDVKSLLIPLPPLPEQQAIASALSDVDALITSLEQLITKKRNIKQGAMQQLLTGKKRLPGFSGEWEVKTLGKLLDYEQPTKYIVKETEYNDNNDTPVLTAGKTLILGYTNEEIGIFRDLPVIIFDDFTTANKYVTFPFKVKSSAMKILKPKNENINLRFVFEKMQLIIFHLGDHKRYWISEYQNLGIELPPLSEQQAIAHILSDMDTDIEALEQKRDKYKAIKQGMMQELLTGKTRLVKEDKA